MSIYDKAAIGFGLLSLAGFFLWMLVFIDRKPKP